MYLLQDILYFRRHRYLLFCNEQQKQCTTNYHKRKQSQPSLASSQFHPMIEDISSHENLMKKLRIALLFGGKSPEHEVSIASAKTIFEKLDRSKYDVLPIPLTRDNQCVVPMSTTGTPLFSLKETEEVGQAVLNTGKIKDQYILQAVSPAVLDKEHIDLIIPIIHGSFGEDGKLQGMLDMLGIPYIGADVLGSAIGMDKEVQKILVHSQGIQIAPLLSFSRHEWATTSGEILGAIGESLTLPYFVKPANAGSSIGITKVKTIEELAAAIDFALQFDTKCLVEQALDNVREIESAVIGHSEIQVASAFSEIIPDREFYDYDAKYHADSTSQVIIPATLTSEEQAALTSAAETVFRVVQCSGFARIDFFLGKDNTVYFNEINTLPGFTPISAFSKMWGASGVEYSDLLDKLIGMAMERAEERKNIQFAMQSAK